jgi:hypothetical protein
VFEGFGYHMWEGLPSNKGKTVSIRNVINCR